jgi:hypothetical protein
MVVSITLLVFSYDSLYLHQNNYSIECNKIVHEIKKMVTWYISEFQRAAIESLEHNTTGPC